MSSPELIEPLFALFSGFLSTECSAKRRPYRFLEAIRAARSAPSDDTPRIFLEAGFQAFVAYHVQKPRKANANGQAALRKLFAALDELSALDKQELAQRVNKAQLHPTVASLIQSMMDQTEQPQHSTPKRRRIEEPSTPRELPRLSSSTPDANDVSQYGLIHHAASQTTTNAAPLLELTSDADVAELDLFPEYLRGAIIRNPRVDRKTAAISMNFPSSLDDVNCAMTIEVYPNKVERLAWLIFGAHLETNGNVRELVLPGGLKAVVTQLQGSRPESVLDVFGRESADAIAGAPYRKLEMSEDSPRVATRCVTMSDFSNANRGATITLTLGRRGAAKIYEKLFKSKIHSCYAICLVV